MKKSVVYGLSLSVTSLTLSSCIYLVWTTNKTAQGVLFIIFLTAIILFIGVVCGLIPVIGQIIYLLGTSQVILPYLLTDFGIASSWVTTLLLWVGLLFSIGTSFLIIQVFISSDKAKFEKKRGGYIETTEEVMYLLFEGDECLLKGDWHQALTNYKDALKKAKEKQDQRGQLQACWRLGETYFVMQNRDMASKWYKDAVKLAEQVDIPGLLADLYDLLGRACGDSKEAIEWHEKSIPIKKMWKDKYAIAFSYSALGDRYTDLKEFDKALHYFNDAIIILQQEAQQHNINLVEPLPEIIEDARYKFITDAEMLATRTPGNIYNKDINIRYILALSNLNVSVIYKMQGKFDQALDAVLQSLKLITDLRVIPDLKWQIHTNLGSLYYYPYGDYSKAYFHFTRAIELMEEVTGNIKVEDTQMNYLVEKEDVYSLMVLTCLALKRPEEAVSYVERGKSRILLSMLSNPRLNLNDVDQTLVNRKIELEQLITDIQFGLNNKSFLIAPCNPNTQFENQSERIQQFSEELASVNLQIKNNAKEWRTMKVVPPVDFNTIRNQIRIASVDTTERPLLIEYCVTEDYVIVFLIPAYNGPPSLSVQIIEWPKRIRQEWVAAFYERLHSSEYQILDKETTSDLSTLYIKLISQFLKIIHNWPHTDQPTLLHFVPHKFLHALPFHAAYDMDRQRFLIEDYPIAYTPAANLLQFWQTPEKRARTLRAGALVLGNPTGDLPQAEVEAKAVAKMWQVYPYLREAARKAPLVDPISSTVKDKSVLHLACHGLFNFENPILTHLLLANYERLDLNDILGLRLERASLVVLSACQSANSKRGGGDELIGLTRSFLYAGTPSVIASLWNVDDNSTSELMISFYKHWRNEGLNKVRALQQAQIDYLNHYRNQPQEQGGEVHFRHLHPYFWAAFVLVGDWL